MENKDNVLELFRKATPEARKLVLTVLRLKLQIHEPLVTQFQKD